MSTTTTPTINAGAYVQVSTGSTSVTLQGQNGCGFSFIVSNALPAANALGMLVTANEGYSASLSSLAATDNVYVKALDAARLQLVVLAS